MLRRFFAPLVLCIATLLLSSCALFDGNPGEPSVDNPEFQSVEGLLQQPEFRRGNLPLRTLQVAVIANEWVGDDFTRAAFADASKLLEEQVGIKLDVTLHAGPRWSTRSFLGIHYALREFRKMHPEYDIVVGVSLTSDNESRPCWFRACYLGMVDEERNIALLTLSANVIVHEIGHTFLGIGHSPIGVMRSKRAGWYFSVANRQKILRNKWKDFRFRLKEPDEE